MRRHAREGSQSTRATHTESMSSRARLPKASERGLTSDCTCSIDAVGMLGSSAQSLILVPHAPEETSAHRKVLSRLPSAGKLGMTLGDLKQKLVKPEMIDPANDCLTMCCMRCRSSRSAMTNYARHRCRPRPADLAN